MNKRLGCVALVGIGIIHGVYGFTPNIDQVNDAILLNKQGVVSAGMYDQEKIDEIMNQLHEISEKAKDSNPLGFTKEYADYIHHRVILVKDALKNSEEFPSRRLDSVTRKKYEEFLEEFGVMEIFFKHHNTNTFGDYGSIYQELTNSFLKEVKLGNNITRREILKIIINMTPHIPSDECNGVFSDMNQGDWGCKYAEKALELGIISPSKNFRPNDTVSKIESLKLILNSQNFEKTTQSDDWKKDYVNTALEHGIIESSFSDYNAYPNRAWVFSIAASTIRYQEQQESDNQEEDKLISDEAL